MVLLTPCMEEQSREMTPQIPEPVLRAYVSPSFFIFRVGNCD